MRLLCFLSTILALTCFFSITAKGALPRLVVALDTSGSMAGKVSPALSKFELAVAGIRLLEKDWEPQVGLGLQVTDSARGGKCSAKQLIAPEPYPPSSVALSKSVKGIFPRGGGGSIVAHLKTAAAGASSSPLSILLLTDEISDCAEDGNRSALLALLNESPNLTIHIIDLGASKADASLMKTMTEISGGIFANAKTLKEMESAVQSIRSSEFSRHNLEVMAHSPRKAGQTFEWKLFRQNNSTGEDEQVLTSRGPGFRAILPTGSYFVEANNGKKSLTSTLFVQSTGKVERKLLTTNGEVVLQPITHRFDGKTMVIQDQALDYRILRRFPGRPPATVESRSKVTGPQTFSLPQGIYQVDLSTGVEQHSFPFSVPGDRKRRFSLEVPDPVLSQSNGEG